jgi:hypothetical protein
MVLFLFYSVLLLIVTSEYNHILTPISDDPSSCSLTAECHSSPDPYDKKPVRGEFQDGG